MVMRRPKSCSRRVGDWWWWGSLAMVPAWNKAKCLLPANHTTKIIHHLNHSQQQRKTCVCFYHQTSFLGTWNIDSESNCAHLKMKCSLHASSYKIWFMISEKIFLHCGARFFTVVHVSSLWCTFLYCGARFITMVHVSSLWCTFLHYGTRFFTVVHVSSLWCTFLHCGACFFTVVHVSSLWYTFLTLMRVSSLWCTFLRCGTRFFTVVHVSSLWYTFLHCGARFFTAVHAYTNVSKRLVD